MNSAMVRIFVWDSVAKTRAPLDVQVTVDVDKLAELLGRKARANKHGVTRVAHGAVVVKVAK